MQGIMKLDVYCIYIHFLCQIGSGQRPIFTHMHVMHCM